MRASTPSGTESRQGPIVSPVVAATIAVFVATAGYPVAAGAVEDPEAGPEGEPTAAVSTVGTVDTVDEATREDRRPHVAAFVGIVALAMLGGSLVVRNRFTGRPKERTRPQGEEVVTDRERVRQLIADNGGRMRQSEIVDSVEWSKAKVSRLLADLEADGEITKLRLGRENLICLPGHEPRASRPPRAGDR